VSKNISISDEVYRKLKREKGDRSFSEVIDDRLDESARIADVAGQGILDTESIESVSEDIEELSEGALNRLEDDAV